MTASENSNSSAPLCKSRTMLSIKGGTKSASKLDAGKASEAGIGTAGLPAVSVNAPDDIVR